MKLVIANPTIDPTAWVTEQLAHLGGLISERRAHDLVSRMIAMPANGVERPPQAFVVLSSTSGDGYVMTSEVCWRIVAALRKKKIRCRPAFATRLRSRKP